MIDEQDFLMREMEHRLKSYPQYTFISYRPIQQRQLTKSFLTTDLVIVVAIPEHDFSDLIKLYKQQNKKVAVWVNNIDQTDMNTLFNMDIDGYLSNQIGTSELNLAMHSILSGYQYIDRHLSSILLKEYNKLTSASSKDRPDDLLTEREWDVLEQIVKGKKNEVIADTLHLSPRTVKNHIVSVFRKLGVDNRTSAALCAVRNGWVEI